MKEMRKPRKAVEENEKAPNTKRVESGDRGEEQGGQGRDLLTSTMTPIVRARFVEGREVGSRETVKLL